MSDEVAAESGESPELASPQEGTVASESEVVSETPEGSQEEEAKPRLFTQEELDTILGKRLARERRVLERELAARAAQSQAPQVSGEPLSPDQFESQDAYIDALAQQRAMQIQAQREAHQRESEVLEAYAQQEESARDRFDDFDEVAYNPRLRITEHMAAVIRESEVGADLAYHLGSNPKEAERISKLSPIAQAKELGKIEAKLVETPPTKKTSSAPAPIRPVTAKVAGISNFDTTDPRSIDSMSTSEWIEAERARQRKSMEAHFR